MINSNKAIKHQSPREKLRKFRDVTEVYVILITEFNIVNVRKTVCHIDSVIRETGETIDDGLHRIIVNASVNDGTKSARLMAHFRESDFSDDEFPETSKQINYYKHTKEGSKMMSTVMEKIMKDYIVERDEYRDALFLIKNVDILAQNLNISISEACTFLNKTIEDYEKAKNIIENTDVEEFSLEYA